MKRSPEALASRAQQALDTGRFRAAIADFKELLKTDERPQWREGLAAAYLGRARELTAKGMLKEALTIGEVRLQLCSGAPLDPEHLGLLLRAGNSAAAVRLYLQQAERSLDRQVLAGMRSRFAALHLSGISGLEDELPPDDPVIAQGVPARAALEAWCRGDDEAAARYLTGIPFRSPYRDWVQILKALMKAPTDTSAAQALLQRIPADSAFEPLARAAGISLLSESAFADALGQAGEAVQRFAAALRGWPEGRLKLLRDLRQIEGARAKGLAPLLYRHREMLGEDWVRRQGLPLLVDGFPNSLGQSPLLGGGYPEFFEQCLVEAWHAEEEADPWQVLEAWRTVIEHLRYRADPPAGSDDALRIALIQRRLDTRWRLLDYPKDRYNPNPLAGEVLFELEDSLRYDPDDLPTHIRLIAHHRHGNRLKDARRMLDCALDRWPEDIDLLGEALETAVAGGAFKKAAGFARRILKLDPINTRARDNLLEAHLAHARKQMHKRRADLAKRELGAAVEWVRGEKSELRLEMLHGFLALDTDWQSGADHLRALVERLGGGIRAQLTLALEAVRLGKALGTFMKKLRLPRIKQPQQEDLLGFLRDLREQLDTGQEISREIPAFFQPALKRAAGLELTQQEREAACETLRRCGLHQARLAHARAALKNWPGLPVFVLHAFEAQHPGGYWRVRHTDLNRLEDALTRARGDGDTRTAHRIGELLKQLSFPPPPVPTRRSGFAGGASEDFVDMLEDQDVEGLLDFIRNMGGMPLELREMERMLGGKQMLELMENFLDGDMPDADPMDTEFDPFPRRKPSKRDKPRLPAAEPPEQGGKEDGKDKVGEKSDFPKQPDLFE